MARAARARSHSCLARGPVIIEKLPNFAREFGNSATQLSPSRNALSTIPGSSWARDSKGETVETADSWGRGEGWNRVRELIEAAKTIEGPGWDAARREQFL